MYIFLKNLYKAERKCSLQGQIFFYLCLLLLFSEFSSVLCAQPSPLYGEQDSLLVRGERHVQAERYEEAFRVYTRILATNEVVPARMCYFFSVALHHLGRRREAQRFVETYLAEAVPAAEHYTKAQLFAQQLSQEIDKAQACALCDEEGNRKAAHATCHAQGFIEEECPNCRGQEKVLCSRCYGQGLLIRTDTFDKRLYLPCPRCEGTGREVCSVCEGAGVLRKTCEGCGGTGRVDSKERCTHVLGR